MTKLLPTNWLKNGSSAFIASQLIANFINFIYNAYLGRSISIENFGLITLINTLLALVSVYVVAAASTVNHHSSFLTTHKNKLASIDFFNQTKSKIFTLTLFLTLLWLLSIPSLSKFFYIGDISTLLLFTPVVSLALFYGINRSFLQSQLLFKFVAFLIFFESIIKLISAFVIVQTGFEKFAYLSVPISIILSFIISSFLVKINSKNKKIIKNENYTFPRRFFFSALVMGISTSGFLTLDLVLVKHFLLPASAGEYALLSLAGKMIFLFGSLFNGLIVTFISRDIGNNKDPNPTFYRLLFITIILTIFSYFFIGALGPFTIPLLLGSKALLITPYLNNYSLAISFLTIANTIAVYHLVRHHYTILLITLFNILTMVIGITFFHQNIAQIVQIILTVSSINILATLAFHLLKRNDQFILRNLIDLFDVFSPLPDNLTSKSQKKILIFNWRDTKHKFAGGAEVYIHELAKRWVKEGYAVTIFCGNDGVSTRNDIIDGIRIIRRGGFYFVYVWAFWYYLMKFRNNFDVIIDCQNGIPFFAPFYAKEKIYCLMFHVHQEVFVRSLSKPMAALALVLENRMMPWVYRKTQFITISESSKAEIQALDLGSAGIEVVYPGIDLKTYKQGPKSLEPLVLYVGRLQFYKSVDVFLKSAKTILKQIPNAKFIIAGDGEEKNKLISQSLGLGLEKNVKFLGKVSEKEKISLYQKAWVLVNPSFKEGWGITSIEANACGTPVVASNVSGLKDSVLNPHTGFLVKYGDHMQFAQKIIHLINNQSLRESMSKQSIDWAQNFDWNKSAMKGLDLII